MQRVGVESKSLSELAGGGFAVPQLVGNPVLRDRAERAGEAEADRVVEQRDLGRHQAVGGAKQQLPERENGPDDRARWSPVRHRRESY